MIKRTRAVAVLVVIAFFATTAWADDGDADLLKARASVWRAWFADDVKLLHELVPPETIVISSGEPEWKHQAEVLKKADEFHAAGGKLLRLEFPKTEVQHFGDVAIIYSQ